MPYVADIEYVEDLLEEFNLTPKDKIADLLDVLEDAVADDEETEE